MKDLIIASNNQGKIKEYKSILEPLGFKIVSQSEVGINIEVEETGTTFEENAILKAEAIYKITSKPVLSDDGGLEIEELNNEPGIYSARYKGLKTGEEIRRKILEEMHGKENRKAKFTCCICYIDEVGEKHLFKSFWQGKIAYKEEGCSGFGYDSIFISDEANGKTTASLPKEFKEKYSHRAKTVKLLLNYLENI